MRRACLLVLLAGACISTDIDVEKREFEIVGGGQETGYAPVGYMAVEIGGQWNGPFCGASIVRPDLAVTAAHCIVGGQQAGGTNFAIGFGQVASSPVHAAQQVLVHPGYDQAANQGGGQDLALLVLAQPVTGVQPARIVDPSVGCSYRSVGYGRTITAPADSQEGYTNERKSMALCVNSMDQDPTGISDPGILLITGTDGGLCYGDSGGAMMVEGTTDIVAVHSYILDGTCPNLGEGGVTGIAEWLPWIEMEVGRDPTVSIAKPADGARVTVGFPVEVDAEDDLRLTRVEVLVDGVMVAQGDQPPFAFTAPGDLTDGDHTLEVRAIDHAGRMASATASVIVGDVADPDPGTDPDPDNPGGGGAGGDGAPVLVGGCAVGGSAGAGSAWALAILALGLLARRRRVPRTSGCDRSASSR